MKKLKLNPATWYAWQMIPGYAGRYNVPYCTPIFLKNVAPGKTHNGVLILDFENVFYAEGVQDFKVDVRILKHSEDYIIVDLIHDNDDPDRTAIISRIEFAWIRYFCPNLWAQHSTSSFEELGSTGVSLYLNEIFGWKELPNAEGHYFDEHNDVHKCR